MRIAYFDCPSGAAGDMVVAALVDAGAPLDALRRELEKLSLEGWKLVAREVRKAGFRATKVDVDIDPRTHQHHRTLGEDRKSTRLNSSHQIISYAVFCLKKKKRQKKK